MNIQENQYFGSPCEAPTTVHATTAPAPRPDNPHTAELRAFHELLLSGSATGMECVIGALLGRLQQKLQWKFPYAKGEQVSDAVTDGFMSYWQQPQGYDAALGVPLEAYLFLAASRNLANSIESDTFRCARNERWGRTFLEDFVAPSLSGRNPVAESSSESSLDEERWPVLLKSLKNPRDRQFVELWATDEIRVGAFAKVLLIMHLALEEQRIRVKRTKDRLRTSLRRANAKLGVLLQEC